MRTTWLGRHCAFCATSYRKSLIFCCSKVPKGALCLCSWVGFALACPYSCRHGWEQGHKPRVVGTVGSLRGRTTTRVPVLTWTAQQRRRQGYGVDQTCQEEVCHADETPPPYQRHRRSACAARNVGRQRRPWNASISPRHLAPPEPPAPTATLRFGLPCPQAPRVWRGPNAACSQATARQHRELHECRGPARQLQGPLVSRPCPGLGRLADRRPALASFRSAAAHAVTATAVTCAAWPQPASAPGRGLSLRDGRQHGLREPGRATLSGLVR